MNERNYYFVSYYIRLPRGGFGFGNYYFDCKGPFNLVQFNEAVCKHIGVNHNDVSVISRIKVDAEEAILYERELKVLVDAKKQQQSLFDQPNTKEGDEVNNA